MSIHFLWTSSNKPGSRIIRWGTDSKSSHFAVGFDLDEGARGVVFHSHMQGLRIEWAEDFLEKSRVVWRLTTKLPLKLEAEEALYQAITENYGKPYDFKALAYFAWRSALWKFARKPFPKENRWGDRNDFLCTEIAETMRVQLSQVLLVEIPKHPGMITPDMLYYAMKHSPLLKEE